MKTSSLELGGGLIAIGTKCGRKKLKSFGKVN